MPRLGDNTQSSCFSLPYSLLLMPDKVRPHNRSLCRKLKTPRQQLHRPERTNMLHVVNLACWIGPNAYLVTVPCRWNGWNSQYVNAFGTLRWTCWCAMEQGLMIESFGF